MKDSVVIYLQRVNNMDLRMLLLLYLLNFYISNTKDLGPFKIKLLQIKNYIKFYIQKIKVL